MSAAISNIEVMGVLNITPDSFSDGGKHEQLETALAHAKLMIAQGATIIDIGGESTRPGATRVPLEEEQMRVLPVIRALSATTDVRISIDTMNAQTARAAIEAGATIINDVSGGLADDEMFSVAAETNAQLIISHWRGFSDVMHTQNEYQSIAIDVAAELSQRVEAGIAAGVKREKIVIDPGLGFAKDMQQNWQLVARLDELEKLGLPILVGASRKRFIAAALDEEIEQVDTDRRDLATAVLTALLIQRKLWGVRVHNVRATKDAIAVVQALHTGAQ